METESIIAPATVFLFCTFYKGILHILYNINVDTFNGLLRFAGFSF